MSLAYLDILLESAKKLPDDKGVMMRNDTIIYLIEAMIIFRDVLDDYFKSEMETYCRARGIDPNKII